MTPAQLAAKPDLLFLDKFSSILSSSVGKRGLEATDQTLPQVTRKIELGEKWRHSYWFNGLEEACNECNNLQWLWHNYAGISNVH